MRKLYVVICFTLFTAASWAQEGSVVLSVLDTYEANGRAFDEGAAEIPAYDPGTGYVFITNSQDDQIDVIEILPSGNFQFVASWDLSLAWPDQGGPNSVAVYDGLVAVAVENDDKQANGRVLFYDTDGNLLQQVETGPLPDMLIYTPDGSKLLVANEGEPNDDYTVDPEGSISIIDVATFSETKADFSAFTEAEALRAQGIRIFGPGATPAQDFEPEYIAVSADGSTAWAVLQENNAVAVIDVAKATVVTVVSLGWKDHSKPFNSLDPSNREGGINFRTGPIRGLYMPDAIVAYEAKGETFLVTANEGDARDYDGFSEEFRIGDDEIILDPEAFPDADELKENENFGRLRITSASGDIDNDGLFEELYSYGARSFSIWNSAGELVFDSRNEFEKILADKLPMFFNSTNDEQPSFDSRSDDKGPEPEGVTIGKLGKRTYAFIGLERIGGIMVYDITNPRQARFVNYLNNRDFAPAFDEDNPAGFLLAKDLGPEGLVFISAEDNPTGSNLLVVTNEISGTTTLYEVDQAIPVKAGKKSLASDSGETFGSVSGIYPNPVEEIMNIRIPDTGSSEAVTVSVTDLNGRVLLTTTGLPNQLLPVDMAASKPGMYLVRISLMNGEQVYKVMKR